MFSTNFYTRRRQQKVTALLAVSGVLAAVGLTHAARQPEPGSVSVSGQASLPTAISRDSFGRVAQSPDGKLQAQLDAEGKVVLRQTQTQKLVTIVRAGAHIQGIRFSRDGKALLVHTIHKASASVLLDSVLAFDPTTGALQTGEQYLLKP